MAVLDKYPRSFADLLAQGPGGLPRHDWINKVAFHGARYRSADALERTLLAISDRLGWTDRDFSSEIRRAVRDATTAVRQPEKVERERTPAWPTPHRTARDARQARLALAPQPCGATARQAWEMLWRPQDLVCAGTSTYDAEVRPRDEWFDLLGGLEFVVPNPMRKLSARLPDGKVSSRCRGNAAKTRRWLVVECDLGTDLEEQCRVLSSLDHPDCPLRLVVFSGGKSAHGWFDAARLSPAEQVRWFRHAVFLCHDPKLWLPWQWVRAPGGRRKDGATQEIWLCR